MGMGSEAEALEMLSDIFKGRSFKTLHKRALALSRICNYSEDNFNPKFPILEGDLYLMFKQEMRNGAPTSRFAGYMQATNFCLHVLGSDELRQNANSM